jgi:SAM-dependent methyltransferase
LLWDCHRGADVAELIERDDGYVEVATTPCKTYFSGFEEWSAQERTTIKFARGRVLDVGCGAGRASLYLQKRGLEVWAIDSSPLAIKVCKHRGIKRAVLLPLERVARLGTVRFDTVLMFGNNFGLLGNCEKARHLLLKLHSLTSPKARIIATTRDPYVTKSRERKEYHRWNRRRGRMAGELRLRVRHKKLIGPWFDYLFVSEPEMRRIITGTGWRVDRIVRRGAEAQYAIVFQKN